MKALAKSAILIFILLLLTLLVNGTIAAEEKPREFLSAQETSTPAASPEEEKLYESPSAQETLTPAASPGVEVDPTSVVLEPASAPTSLASTAGLPCHPLPFVYTADVLYGSFGRHRSGNCHPVREAARFHLLVTGPHSHRTRNWCENPDNAFVAIKDLSPNTQILLYRMGPGQYITSTWGAVGDGWEWIKTHHGKGTQDRWTALGIDSGDYLLSLNYPVERAMEIGNRNWQEYWITRNYEDIWVKRINGMNGRATDGIFADGMQYSVSWANGWCAESAYNYSEQRCARMDHPSTYYQNGAYNHALWRQHYDAFLERAVSYYRQRDLRFGLNAWRVGPLEIALYQRLGVTAMEECGFLCTGRTDLRAWTQKLQALQQATNYAIISVNLPPGYSASNGPDAMERTWCADGVCQTGWRWLWYSLGSYWLGYEPHRRNAYFYFSLWEYRGSYWFDEYDPRYLHLGTPLGAARQLTNGVWIREFERGWVAVNPTLRQGDIAIPFGRARVLEHENFKRPEAAPLVDRFTLAPLQGVVLLKEDHLRPLCKTHLPLVVSLR